MKKDYRKQKWFSIESLADFIAECNQDGEYDRTAWEFYDWLDKKCRPKRIKNIKNTDISVDDLFLSTKTTNSLRNLNIRTVGGLKLKYKEDLLDVKGIGAKAIYEIENALSKLNLNLNKKQ
jgi:DNA-directed RNA polymerase alpha subunit